MADATNNFLSSKQVAERLGVARKTLDTWAYKGLGPDFAKIGRQRKYKPSDVEAWVESQMVRHG